MKTKNFLFVSLVLVMSLTSYTVSRAQTIGTVGVVVVEPTEDGLVSQIHEIQKQKADRQDEWKATSKTWDDKIAAAKKQLADIDSKVKQQQDIIGKLPSPATKAEDIVKLQAAQSKIVELTKTRTEDTVDIGEGIKSPVTALKEAQKAKTYAYAEYSKDYDDLRKAEGKDMLKLWHTSPKTAEGKRLAIAPKNFQDLQKDLDKTKADSAKNADATTKFAALQKSYDELEAKYKHSQVQVKSLKANPPCSGANGSNAATAPTRGERLETTAPKPAIEPASPGAPAALAKP
jgi:vacuolar-type H+-ATPase subunit I/STV1